MKSTLFYFILAACGALGLHYMAGASLPFPCGDEVVFYYPAQSLANMGSLATPHLHPDREMLWMPPGYMAVLAGWIKTVGPGLLAARWLSYVLAMGAAGLLWALMRRLGLPAAGIALLGLAMLSRHWVVMGNMVRMEGLLLCLLLGGVHLIYSSRWLAGAAVMAAALLVHPNGIYGLAFVPVLAYLSPGCHTRNPLRSLPRPVLWEWLLAGMSALALLAYGWHVYALWPAFLEDWRWQLSSRSSEGTVILLFRPDQAVFALALAGLGYLAWRRQARHIGTALAVAVMFWMMRVLGQGWAYGVFNVIAVVLVSAAMVEAVVYLGSRYLRGRKAWVAMAIPWLVSAFLCLGLWMAQVLTTPFYRPAYHWMGMTMQSSVAPYYTDQDRARLLSRLYAALPPTPARRPHRLYFVPEGDGMLYAPADTGRILHVLPIYGRNLPTHFVVHQSASAAFFGPAYEETLRFYYPTGPLPKPILARDSTEAWYLIECQDKYPSYIVR